MHPSHTIQHTTLLMPCMHNHHHHHTTPSPSLNATLHTKHLPFSRNHRFAQFSCATCPHSGNMTARSLSLNCDRQIGHFVTRTPSNDNLSLTFPCEVVRRESTMMSAGSSVDNAADVAAGSFPGPRNDAIWAKPYEASDLAPHIPSHLYSPRTLYQSPPNETPARPNQCTPLDSERCPRMTVLLEHWQIESSDRHLCRSHESQVGSPSACDLPTDEDARPQDYRTQPLPMVWVEQAVAGVLWVVFQVLCEIGETTGWAVLKHSRAFLISRM